MEHMEMGSEKLMNDLKTVVTDTEALLQATASDASEQAANARTRAVESLRNARTRIVEAEQQMVARAKATAVAANGYVHENPWPAIGMAAGLAFVAGLLAGRR